MNSSTSSSEQGAEAQRWRRWLAIVALAPVVFVLATCITIVLDPFSTGRYTPLAQVQLATRDLVSGHVARARDPMFDAAIAGNSHAVVLDPARLTRATGRRFAQLSSLGLNPDEILTVATAFARGQRDQARAIVLVLDESFCAADAAGNRVRGFFPRFLFESSAGEYFAGLISPQAVDAAAYRLLMLAGVVGDRQRRDGYSPIRYTNAGWTAAQLAAFDRQPRPALSAATGAPFHGLELLRARATEFKAEMQLVLFFTPVAFFSLPEAGSPAEQRLNLCKDGFRNFARSRPNSVFIDRMRDDAFARDMRNFGDITHVHNQAAPLLESEIAAAFAAPAR